MNNLDIQNLEQKIRYFLPSDYRGSDCPERAGVCYCRQNAAHAALDTIIERLTRLEEAQQPRKRGRKRFLRPTKFHIELERTYPIGWLVKTYWLNSQGGYDPNSSANMQLYFITRRGAEKFIETLKERDRKWDEKEKEWNDARSNSQT